MYPKMFKMVLCDGTVLEVGDDHNHIVVHKGKELVCTTTELLDIYQHCEIPLCKPIQHTSTEYEINYTNLLKKDIKYIHKEYIVAPIEDRIKILNILLERYAFIDPSGVCIVDTPHTAFAKGLQALVQSLGGYSKLTTTKVRRKVVSQRVTIQFTDLNPFSSSSSLHDEWQMSTKLSKKIESLLEMECVEPGYCIKVADKTQSYITDGYTVTHNTTLFAEYLILYIAVFGGLPHFEDITVAIYVADSMENGAKKLRGNVESRYLNSDFLQQLLPRERCKFTDALLVFENIEGKKLYVDLFGVKTGVRGVKHEGRRVDLIICDDLLSDKNAESPTIINDINNVIDKAIAHMVNPNKYAFIWSGTPFNKNDPLYTSVESGAYKVNAYPVCEKFPCSKEEFRSAWGDRFTYQYVMAKYKKAKAKGNVQSFYQELMLKVIDEDTRLIHENDIRWYDSKTLLMYKKAYNFYITSDLATSISVKSDYRAICVWALNCNNDWFLVDGVLNKLELSDNIDKIFEFASKYKPLEVGIEVTGQQGGFISWIETEMIRRNIFFNLASANNSGLAGIRPTSNKFERFLTVVPRFKLKKMYLAKDQKNLPLVVEFLEEVLNCSNKTFQSKYDDVADCISMLQYLNISIPSSRIPIDSELDPTKKAQKKINDIFKPKISYSRSTYIC
jgi:hypothetical protein